MSDLFHRTLKALEKEFTCELIASSLDFEEGVFAVSTQDNILVSYASTPGRGFNRVPLRAQAEHGEVTHVAILDLVRRRVLERRVLTPEDVTSGTTPISRAIELLAGKPFFFVLTPHEIGMILTRSDLNRLPVRTYLYTLLSHLEGQLSDLIVKQYEGETWVNSLSPDGQNKIRQLHSLKRRQDFDTRLVDCTTLTQKLSLAEKLPELRRTLGYEGRAEFKKSAGPVRELRDRLAHGMLPISDPGLPLQSAQLDGQPPDDRAEDAAELLRDHLHHRQPLVKPRSPRWLADVTRTVLRWIDRTAAQPD